ncbi:cell envelope-related function transcriptional attenuator common domain-containing protein [Lentibacillus persicus]|uniref:Cell envelope-related function transcriptional attenuator common domain-containing protein n=1 Tax=Lentibacillus persicus TaxID=640948 RepID=A0A1I2AJD4_9BACI|nr:LCP family protein [Lentibacillus persicus]SFE44012.1 cell envelope-related function transcriptional attenuator common domain-containing protein [Lentibacillus persicus]
MDETRTNRNRKKPKRRWLKITLAVAAVVLILIAGAGAYAYSIYGNARDTVNDEMHEPVDSIDRDMTKKKMEASEPLNILLLGVDEREHDSGRSDALMVLSLNPEKDSMQLVSIPRDTRTTIVGKGFEDKINHAYAFGGSDMSVATVENFLDIELDHYVRMNMEGLSELVDKLGTITVDNEIAWQNGEYDFNTGPVEMDGNKTMAYVRMRKQDPDGDFGRTERQRKVIQGIIEQGASVGSVGKINDYIDVLGNNMATNMDFDDMKSLLNGYRNTRQNIVSYQMKGSGTNIDGIYYLMVPDEEIAKVHGMIKKERS